MSIDWSLQVIVRIGQRTYPGSLIPRPPVEEESVAPHKQSILSAMWFCAPRGFKWVLRGMII